MSLNFLERSCLPLCCRSVALENADLGLDLTSSLAIAELPSSTMDRPEEAADSSSDDANEPACKRSKRCDPGSHDDTTDRNRATNACGVFRPRSMPSAAMSVARPIPVMKGHSAFLTFAYRPFRSNSKAEDVD